MKQQNPIETALRLLIIGVFGFVTILYFFSKSDSKPKESFVDGQILLPDMVHSDTLIVVDAKYLNQCMNDGKLKSDGDIMEILNETTEVKDTEPYYHSIIIEQETDDRGLTSVVFRDYRGQWGLDYLNKREYDSLFSKSLNYRP